MNLSLNDPSSLACFRPFWGSYKWSGLLKARCHEQKEHIVLVLDALPQVNQSQAGFAVSLSMRTEGAFPL
jgi:hypothetical protein